MAAGGAAARAQRLSPRLEAAANMARQWAEGTRSALQAISDTMRIQMPAGIGDKIDQVAAVLEMAVSKMQAVALRFGAEGLNAVTNFSDAANKVFGALSTAYTLFERIAETGDKVLFGSTRLAASTDALAEKVVIIMNNLGPRVACGASRRAPRLGAFADASGKVFTAFSVAFDFFTKIAETGENDPVRGYQAGLGNRRPVREDRHRDEPAGVAHTALG